MKKIVILFFAVQLLTIAQDKTPDFNLTGAGARAEGFGGAFIGISDDATAVVWNPAGLSQLERAEASVVTRFIGEGSDYKDEFDPAFNIKETQSYFNFNFASFALPLVTGGENNIVVAVAFQRQLDFDELRRRDFDFTDNFGNTITIRQRIQADGGVNTVTPAVGVRIMPTLSFGVSANIWMGSMKRVETVTGTSGSTTERDQTTFESDFSGFNIVFGGLLDLEGMKNGPIPLKIGVTFRTPFTLTSDGDYDEDLQSGPPFGRTRYRAQQEVGMPFMLGFGASYRIGDKFTIASDFEMRNFSGKKIKSTFSIGPNSISGDQRLSESDNDLNQFRIGGEYLIVMDNGVIPIRLGFKTVPTVLSDYAYDDATDEYHETNTQVSGSGISVGSGFISDAFALDLVLSTTQYTQKYNPGGSIDYSTMTIGSSIIIYF